LAKHNSERMSHTESPWLIATIEIFLYAAIYDQFDSHDKSPVPHQRSFVLPYGFLIDAGETLYIYRLFDNFDEKPTNSSDGWVMLYYTTE